MYFIPRITINDYPQMLLKLSRIRFYVAFVCILLLREFVPPVKRFSAYIDEIFPKDLINFEYFPLSYVGVFILVLIINYTSDAIKLHDKISDLFQIRKEFDVHYVLYPLAIASGSNLNVAQFESVRRSQTTLMNSIFYKYVSSVEAVIDSHTITQALTNWSWFWACLESIAFFTIVATILFFYAAWQPAAWLFISCAVLLLLMRHFRLQSAKYAERQVLEVLGDDKRRADVAQAFRAL